MESDPITESFELAAERCEDLTPLVYARLFQSHPELQAHFWREPKAQIQGEMLAKVIEALLDFVGERRYADVLIRSEAVTHDGYEVPPAQFGLFFGAVAETVKALLGPAWTPAIDRAWSALLAELDAYVGAPV